MAIEDVDAMAREVNDDLVEGFSGIFQEEEDDEGRVFAVQEPFTDRLVQANGVTVMAWTWHVRHVGPIRRLVPDRPEPPEGIEVIDVQFIPVTSRAVTIHGITVIDDNGGEPLFTRYIDWLGVYAELGAVTMARPLVDERRR